MSVKSNILLVDDGPGDVKLMQLAFRKVAADHQLHVVRDGQQATDFLRRAPGYEDAPQPNLILLDLNMPIKNGYQVLLDLKADEHFSHIPIVVLTGSDNPQAIKEAYTLHANSVITKPSTVEKLSDLVSLVTQYWLSVIPSPGKPDTQDTR